MYGKTKLNAHYFTTKGFYIFFIPVKVPYKAVYQLADSAGVKKTLAHGPIVEKGSLFGFGWIGVEIEKPSTHQKDVVHISGDFETYRHTGPYKTLGQAYKRIMKERTKPRECYNIYLDDPVATPPEKCRTDILFR
jgi:effector-binding domain-containing protein